MIKKSTFMDNTPFGIFGFYEAENCAILPKKMFSTKCMNPIIPDRIEIFIISTLKTDWARLKRVFYVFIRLVEVGSGGLTSMMSVANKSDYREVEKHYSYTVVLAVYIIFYF